MSVLKTHTCVSHIQMKIYQAVLKQKDIQQLCGDQ